MRTIAVPRFVPVHVPQSFVERKRAATRMRDGCLQKRSDFCLRPAASTQQVMKDWFSGKVREMSLAVEVGCTPEIRSRLP